MTFMDHIEDSVMRSLAGKNEYLALVLHTDPLSGGSLRVGTYHSLYAAKSFAMDYPEQFVSLYEWFQGSMQHIPFDATSEALKRDAVY